ncbi:multiple epidermal growth factor-like domains protein 10 [Gigantopelta aegis]|uniref:multiple epidermal growth factor-like domains protein 10 n=1 Tax=Gigantopelta aegis TaxID=1735272 RepID=UPI001B887BF5|nr:multiple epidermal growth factor-like domains protein 10 [Gigantopelta aegis]
MTHDCKGGLTYGDNCGKRCADRHCLNNSTCEANTGLCVGGCQPGWKDLDCSNECNDRYGAECSLDCNTRHCKNNNSPCHSRTGECVGGCKPGWMNATCTQQCAQGHYGDGCSNQCKDRQCYTNGTCDFQTGRCFGGCQAGWEGQSCTSECTDGKYGMNCNAICGECANELCDRVTGNCTDGCSDGFEGHLCKEVSPQKASDSTTVVSSAVMGVLSIIVIIQFVVIIRYILIVRKVRASSGPSVSFSNKPITRTTTTTSSVYEVVDDETNVRSPPAERVANTQNGQTNGTQHDYVNSSHQAERSGENGNHYDRLDVDVIGAGSPYSKIEV